MMELSRLLRYSRAYTAHLLASVVLMACVGASQALMVRLIGPVFLDALPGKIRRNVLRMLEFFTTYLQSGQTKPSSLDQLVALGARPLPDQRESLRNSLQYWAARNGYGQAETERAA